ncbi:MAG: hypothetical protein Phog2KO_42150 [Phototrophicaceae bacterium]
MRRMIALLLLIMTISSVQAQSTSDSDGWEIVENCISEPTTPPDDWSYEGIIFMFSDVGIHGLNYNIQTPYVIAYDNPIQAFTLSGDISPDGNWFAVPQGYIERRDYIVDRIISVYQITGIRLHSTDGSGEKFTHNLSSEFWGYAPYQYVIGTIAWTENNEIIYPSLDTQGQRIYESINPSTGIQQIYDGNYSPRRILFLNSTIGQSSDERNNVAFDSLNSFSWLIPDPYSTVFSVISNNSIFVGDTDTELFTNICISATSIVYAPTGEFVISTGEEILLIDGENTYRLATHNGTVFDWRFPVAD